MSENVVADDIVLQDMVTSQILTAKRVGFLGRYMIDGRLFTRDFLLEGIRETAQWCAVDDAALLSWTQRAREMMVALASRNNANEAQTEADLVYPLLETLSWLDRDPQPSLSEKRRLDVPDALLYPDAAAKVLAAALQPAKRFLHGLCIVEAKRWGRVLDHETWGQKDEEGTPSSQMLRYLRRADDRTQGKLRWGILTNGRLWRLYFHAGTGTSENFLEVDLGMALQVAGCEPDIVDRASVPEGFTDEEWRAHAVRLFVVLFGRMAFLPDAAGESFHQLALREGRRWEEKVKKTLSEKVFGEVFPTLVHALAKADPLRQELLVPAYLDEVRQGALILLYRLLFVLYAEDRSLLPDESGPYAEFCLTRLRFDVAKREEEGKPYPRDVVTIWPRLTTIFSAIASGNDDLGIPPYNGGLFEWDAAPILTRVQLPDVTLGAIILALSHEPDAGDGRGLRYINYRDLSVQQLGSVYERLLEYKLVADGPNIKVALSAFGRKSSGSYYTPDELVQLIILRTLGPLVEEAETTFNMRAKRAKARLEELSAVDPAEAILRLRVCDPAMGSGHFLVTLVDWMTDRVLDAMAAAELAVPGYASPVAARIEAIRERILMEADQHRWPIVRARLDNKSVVRRMVLKRCVYGVDLNPMAVELAKVALWLHSFTVGAPLSFLDHHLVCGNALFGERVRPVMDWAYGGNLLINDMVQKARGAARGMERVEELTDADIAEAKSSRNLFDEVQTVTKDLRAFMNLVHGVRWAGGDKVQGRAIARLQRGEFGDPIKLLNGEIAPPAVSSTQRALLEGVEKKLKLSLTEKKALSDAQERAALPRILADVREALGRERFLHWEVAFPGVWTDWDSVEPKGGFDAVIGNPPWDQMMIYDVEWFAERKPEIALITRGADRKREIDKLLDANDPLGLDFKEAIARVNGSVRVARESGVYPLLSGGRMNLYSLFVERALALVKPAGIVGLLTPSGIASDKSASTFFKSVATTGRLGSLIDFENRRGDQEDFFPDVDSRFKFCVLVVGGPRRVFEETLCAFFLRGVEALTDPERAFTLSPADFAKVNPNTGTAPIFRTRRDAALTIGIYDRLPVLVDRRGAEPVKLLPIRSTQMLNMTTDSHLFVTKAELEKVAYPVGGGRWRRGAEEFVPLYEGKMVQAFDHRAASVIVNPENLNRPAQPEPATDAQRADPAWLPNPQYMVASASVDWPQGVNAALGFKDITASTNVRTMIAALVPFCGAGHTLPLILPDLPDRKPARVKTLAEYHDGLPLLVANLNALPFDYVARQKVQSTHLNWYIVEQLPVVPLAGYARAFGSKTARDIVREEVLALTYTAHDMAPFARDMGHNDLTTGEVKPPFKWDALDRLRRRAKLDALYFMLYFPSGTPAEMSALHDTASYIYSSFPIVEREEMAAHGRYLSCHLCLLYLNALAAGDPDVHIVL
ncbi:MAG: restriction endonuclease [Betaproteobacteria bacterium]|nr:restriction endonuclease [Betaproteobacteria bacterium]